MANRAQNRKLYDRWKAGDDSARQELIEANLLWAQKLANDASRYYTHHDPDDIYQFACMGLMTAVDRWNPKKGTLTTYAYRWIRQSIQRGVDNEADLIRIPVHVQEDLRKRGHERARAIAERTEVPEAEGLVAEALAVMYPDSLDRLSQFTDKPIYDPPYEEEGYALVEDQGYASLCESIVPHLDSDTQRSVFDLLTNEEGITEAEIARKLDRSRESINQSVRKIRRTVDRIVNGSEIPAPITLADTRRSYVRVRLEQGASTEEIASELGITKTRVGQIKNDLQAIAV